MANKITNTDNYTNIANAIRSKNGSSDTYTPAQMPAAINNIVTKCILPAGTKLAFVSSTFSTFDGTHLDVSGVTSMRELFSRCTSLETADLTG